MGFDVAKFEAAKITPVTKTIPVPELAAFFEANEVAEWTVKNLDGPSLAQVNEEVSNASKLKAVIEGIAAGTNDAMKKAIETHVGGNKDVVPEDLVRRHKMLQLGSVPECPYHIVVRLAVAKPTTFYKLTNEIIRLTGDGANLGE